MFRNFLKYFLPFYTLFIFSSLIFKVSFTYKSLEISSKKVLVVKLLLPFLLKSIFLNKNCLLRIKMNNPIFKLKRYLNLISIFEFNSCLLREKNLSFFYISNRIYLLVHKFLMHISCRSLNIFSSYLE